MNNKKCSFKLDAYKGHELKDGSYPVMLVVRKDKQRATINLAISADPEQWNNETQRYVVDRRSKNLHPDRVINNTYLDKISGRCDEVVEDFQKKRIDWTLTQFKNSFLNKSKKSSVEEYFKGHIAKLSKSGNVGNMICYQRTLDMLKMFDPKFESLVFQDIDLKYVERFDQYLRVERKCANNTIKYYMRAFRALINKAKKDGEASESTYPFGKNGYSVAELSQETQKRYLPSDYIEKLKSAEIENFTLQWVRNLFLFSYYCQGMAFVDIATLKSKNFQVLESGKYICYRRQKTEGKNTKIIRIKINSNIQELLDWFKINCLLIDDYLTPIITRSGYEGERFYNHVRDRNRKFNKHLKKLGEKLEFEGIRLSSYMSRHSYAMRLKNSGVSEDIISEALGHKDMTTTKVYLDSFQKDEIDKANELL